MLVCLWHDILSPPLKEEKGKRKYILYILHKI